MMLSMPPPKTITHKKGWIFSSLFRFLDD